MTALRMIKKVHPLQNKITIAQAFPALRVFKTAKRGLAWGAFNEFDRKMQGDDWASYEGPAGLDIDKLLQSESQSIPQQLDESELKQDKPSLQKQSSKGTLNPAKTIELAKRLNLSQFTELA